MADAEKVVLELEARTQNFTAAINGVATTTDSAVTKVERSASRLEAIIQRNAQVQVDAVSTSGNAIVAAINRQTGVVERQAATVDAAVAALVGALTRQATAAEKTATVEENAAQRGTRARTTAAADEVQLSDRVVARRLRLQQQIQRDADGAVAVSGKVANAQRNLGRQISDIGTGLAGGQSPFLIIAQQAPQVADALSDTGGKVGKFAAALSGPAGAAALAVGSILGTVLIPKLLESGTGVDDLVAKFKKQAVQAGLNAQATEAFSHTLEGLAESAKKARDEIEKTNRTQFQSLQLTYGQNEAHLTDLTQKRAAAQKVLNDALGAQYRIVVGRNKSIGSPEAEESQRVAEQVAANRVAVAQAKFNLAQQGALDAQVAAAGARIPILDYQAAATDKATAATHRQEAAIGELRKAYDAAAKAADKLVDPTKRQKTLDDAAHAYRVGVERANADLAKAQKDIQDATAASKAGPLTSFISPVNGGRISSGFGPRVAPTAGASTFHPGIDIAAPIGTPVRAAAGGVVIYAGKLGGLGNAIIVDHGSGTITEYGHLSSILTSKGARVDQGENIGAVGSTGISTGPHLDYRVKTGGRYVDPRTARFRTDETATGIRAANSAQTAESKAEADRVRAIRDNESYEREKESLNADIVRAMQAQAVNAEDIAEFQRQAVDAATSRKIAGYNADEAAQLEKADSDAQREVIKQRAQNLRNLALQGDALQKLAIGVDLQRRQQDEATARIATNLRNQEDLLSAQLSITDTNARRKAIELQILDIKYQELRNAQQAILDDKSHRYSDEDRAKAQTALNTLPDLQRAARVGIDQRYEGPLAQYRRGLNDPQAQVEQAVADKLKSVDQAITDAAANVLGVKDPLLKSLLQIFLQQNVLKPIYDALSQAQGGGSGGGIGGIFSSVASLFGGGGSPASLLGKGNGAPPPVALPGLADGGTISVGGNGGVDRNMLAINGQPVARINRGERLAVVPSDLAANASARAAPGGGTTVIYAPQTILKSPVMVPALLEEIDRRNAEGLRAAAPHIAKSGAQLGVKAMQEINRYGQSSKI